MTWEQLSEKSGVSMGTIIYVFIEKYKTFHVRLTLEDMINLCVALDIDISLLPLRMYV